MRNGHMYSSVMVLVALLGTLLTTLAEPEHHHSASNHVPKDDHIKRDHYDADGKHQDSFDHKAILGSKEKEEEFAAVSPEESKMKLRKMLAIMDMDNNQVITQAELTKWVLHSYSLMDEDGAKSMMVEFDKNKDGLITIEEYMEEESKENANEEQLAIDNLKFNAADLNHDGKLNVSEFAAFLYPYDYAHMKDVEVGITISEMDTDKDGTLSLREFIGDTEEMKKPEMDEFRENFDKYDLDRNDKLDANELAPWVMHDSSDTASDEAKHLIEATDADKNGELSYEEILDKYELWVGHNKPTEHQEL